MLPGRQDVVNGVAQLEQLVLVAVETVGGLQLFIVEGPETEERRDSPGSRLWLTCGSPVLQQLASR